MTDFETYVEQIKGRGLSADTQAQVLRAMAEMEKAKALHSISLQLSMFIQYWAAKNDRP